MTLREALALYKQFKNVAVYKLTEHDWKRLQRAAQIIRASRKTRNPRSRPGLRKNPASNRVKIYGQLLRIEAKKTQIHRCDASCRRAGHSYYHDFKPGAVIYGMPDGSIRIVSKTGERLWKMF
jgi:hypothetical protein